MTIITPLPSEPPALPVGSRVYVNGHECMVAYDFDKNDTSLHVCTLDKVNHFTIKYVRFVSPKLAAGAVMVLPGEPQP